MRRFIALAAAALLAAGLLTGCGGSAAGSSIKRPQVESEELQFQAPAEGDPIAIFNTSAGEVRAVLYPDVAPMAVENFTRLAQEGYYNGTSFHRIVSGFVVQGATLPAAAPPAPPSGTTTPIRKRSRTSCTIIPAHCAPPSARTKVFPA